MSLLRLPYAQLNGKDAQSLRGQFAIVNVDHVVHLGPFINKNPEAIAYMGAVRLDYCTLKLSDGSWLYIGLPMEIVAAMLADEDASLTPEEWLEYAEDARGEEE